MTRWEHGINQKVVINLDHGGAKHVCCAWDDCENDGYELYKLTINYGKAETPRIVTHVFCCERHKQYFIHGSLHDAQYGRLPPGFRRSYI
jgi:hypothetical protein